MRGLWGKNNARSLHSFRSSSLEIRSCDVSSAQLYRDLSRSSSVSCPVVRGKLALRFVDCESRRGHFLEHELQPASCLSAAWRTKPCLGLPVNSASYTDGTIAESRKNEA